MDILISGLEELKELAKKIAKYCKKNTYILLGGELGAGKTTFSKFLLAEIGVKEVVSSPTFVIMNQYYVDDLKINHVDAYRLQNDSEIDMYLEEFDNSLNLIEWYNNLGENWQNVNPISIDISIIDEDKRMISIKGI